MATDSVSAEITLSKLYTRKNNINELLDCKDCSPNEEDDLLYELDSVCDQIDALEAPKYSNLNPCNF